MSRTTVSQNGENLDLEKRELSGSTSHDEHSSSEAVGEAATVRDSSLGTFYQSKVNLHRGFLRNLFLPLDKEYMNAVHRDAEGVIYEDGGEEERKIKRKIDNRILPLIILSFVFNQFDRTNTGNAHVIPEFNENFVSACCSRINETDGWNHYIPQGITDNNKWTLALSIFYVGYCLLEMPANGS
ncbi:hypothetical protein VKT23_008801 [Stygiomarasmius scandens]|uniref:Uncharacterized protein n=1 Tax=Marasmiellus scandens TaxID=2682957 RepID=A0ABR1JKW5_9AGAR